MKIKQFSMVNGILLLIKDMEGEYKLGLMVVGMKDIGKMIKLTLEEN